MDVDDVTVTGWSKGTSGTVFRGERLVHVEHVWNTAISLHLTHAAHRPDEARAAVNSCSNFFARVDEILSPFRPLSEVVLYRAGIHAHGWSAEFEVVRKACDHARRLTLGAFDPWAVPSGYDPSGLVKGWAAQQASDLLMAAGFPDHLINAGGDVVARGDQILGSGGGWSVGIVNPHAPSDIVKTAVLHDLSMATSARYERGEHVIDPRRGRPALDVDSATVVGPDGGLVDAFASAALVDGQLSMRWFANLGDNWSLYLVIGQQSHSYGPAFDGTVVEGMNG